MPMIPNLSPEQLEMLRSAVQGPAMRLAALPKAEAEFIAWPFVDTLYDYTQILNSTPLASFPSGPPQNPVFIVGAGAAGMVAAYELLRAGIVPIVLEASDRIGGRNWSQDFQGSNLFAEMGAMRVPVSNKVFWHYAGPGMFNLQTGPFPDPGVVPTNLYYENTLYDWKPGTLPPSPFTKITADFYGFMGPLLKNIWTPWMQEPPDLSQVQKVWQSYIDRYANMSVFEALRQGIPQWTTEDFTAFGALGVGTGGFGPFFTVDFLEMLRLLVNQFETSQKFIVDGFSQLTWNFYTQPVTMPNGTKESLQSLNAVLFNAPVSSVGPGTGTNPSITYLDPNSKSPITTDASAIIVANTTRSMQISLGLTILEKPVISQPVRNALRDLHMMDTSKMFIRTATKFWLDKNGQPVPGIPQTIQTDELPRGVFCLDYPTTQNGIVLISYTWGDDSSKLLGLDVPARFETFKNILNIINPQFAQFLVPLNNEILNVDWQAEPYYFGGYKLQNPGQEPYIKAANYQFLDVLNPSVDTGIYLAGDGVSWSGGWTEGALQTGLNAACAAAQRIGGTVVADSPLTQDPNRYDYGS
ncbi:MAG TPA: NAD(P)/FAD-dependent oxidoreductase [Pyrinomonadaceae bacterium]|nr:NAD(P)/FAD-dependent oxidoreductase [Pyrinomonadaceae bacterium]